MKSAVRYTSRSRANVVRSSVLIWSLFLCFGSQSVLPQAAGVDLVAEVEALLEEGSVDEALDRLTTASIDDLATQEYFPLLTIALYGKGWNDAGEFFYSTLSSWDGTGPAKNSKLDAAREKAGVGSATAVTFARDRDSVVWSGWDEVRTLTKGAKYLEALTLLTEVPFGERTHRSFLFYVAAATYGRGSITAGDYLSRLAKSLFQYSEQSVGFLEELRAHVEQRIVFASLHANQQPTHSERLNQILREIARIDAQLRQHTITTRSGGTSHVSADTREITLAARKQKLIEEYLALGGDLMHLMTQGGGFERYENFGSGGATVGSGGGSAAHGGGGPGGMK